MPPSGAIPWSIFASSNKYQLLLADVLCRQLCRNRGFRWFKEPGPPSSWGSRVGPHLHSTHRDFNSRRGHLNTTSIKTLGDPTGGAYTAPQARIAGPLQAPLPLSALRASSFRTWGWSNWGNPSYCWTRAPQSLATPPCAAIFGSHCQRRGAYCLDTLLCLLEALTVYHQWQFTAVSAATVQARRQILLQARSLSWSACKLLLLNTNPISVSRQIKSFLLLLHYTSDLHQILCACYLCRGSVFLWRRSDTLCTSSFMDDVVSLICEGCCSLLFLKNGLVAHACVQRPFAWNYLGEPVPER